MKEPQNADPILKRALNLKIADEACALLLRIASDFFFDVERFRRCAFVRSTFVPAHHGAGSSPRTGIEVPLRHVPRRIA